MLVVRREPFRHGYVGICASTKVPMDCANMGFLRDPIESEGGDIGGPAKGSSSSNCAIPGVTSMDVVC